MVIGKAKFAFAGIATAIMVVLAALQGCDSNAQEAEQVNFVGLWQGIDEVDGGNSYRSIFPNSDQSGYKRLGRDTWHGPCGYGDPAVIKGSLIEEHWNSLEGSWNLYCLAEGTSESPDRSYKVRYTFDSSLKTLTETLLDPQTEQPIDRIPIVFFRVAPIS